MTHRTLEQLKKLMKDTPAGGIIPVTLAEFNMMTASGFSHLDLKVIDKDLASQSIAEVLQERGSRYGSFSGHAFITQQLKDAMENSPNWGKISASQKEALQMVVHKIGRILNGDPNYLDSWVDIIGYTQLIVDQLNGKDT